MSKTNIEHWESLGLLDYTKEESKQHLADTLDNIAKSLLDLQAKGEGNDFVETVIFPTIVRICNQKDIFIDNSRDFISLVTLKAIEFDNNFEEYKKQAFSSVNKEAEFISNFVDEYCKAYETL